MQPAFKQSIPVEQVVVALVADHQERIGQLFAAALDAIERGLNASRVASVMERRADKSTAARLINLGPDHYAQLTAARALLAILTAGRQASKPAEPNPRGTTISWQQYEELWAQKQADLAAGSVTGCSR